MKITRSDGKVIHLAADRWTEDGAFIHFRWGATTTLSLRLDLVDSIEPEPAPERDLPDLSTRTRTCLHKAGIVTRAQVEAMSDEQLREIRFLGEVGIAELRAVMRGDPPPPRPPCPGYTWKTHKSDGASVTRCGNGGEDPRKAEDWDSVDCKLCLRAKPEADDPAENK